MGMRIRHLELTASTAQGIYGIRIPFKDGLTVLWANNTSGKSTCMSSILWALGLEGMLGPSFDPPLTGAMLDKLLDGDVALPIVGSQVRLEIQNDAKQTITIQRMVKCEEKRDRQLIHVEFGPAITTPGDYVRRDYFVRIGGSATLEQGFHTFLAKFIAYELPLVNTADQRQIPLYLQCFFPFFFVEQISGWRDLKSRMPTYLAIPDMAKRATEFVFEFDVLRREVRRQELQLIRQQLIRVWKQKVELAKNTFQGTGAMINGLPDMPPGVWPISPGPQLMTTDGDVWMSFEQAVEHYRKLQSVIANEAIPKAEQASEHILGEITETEESLYLQEKKLDDLTSAISSERSNVEAIDSRLETLFEDLRKYQSTKKVLDRSGMAESPTAKGKCPTCDQPIKDALLSQDSRSNPMSVEDNILFLQDQIKTFGEMREDSRRLLVSRSELVGAVQRDVSDLSARLRAQ